MDENSPIYNLKVVVSETGVKPETLRAWERRYGFPKPKRSAGGHRLYTLRDVRTINWLIERQKEGLSISRAVELWKGLEDSGQDPLHAESLSQPLPTVDRSSLELLRQEWIDACLNFNEQAADMVITQAFAIAPPELVCFEILQSGLSEIGQRWFQGTVSVQQEHFATAQAIKRLHLLLNAAPPPSREGVLLAVCPAGETHEFGLLLAALLLRRQGWEVIYLGANVPLMKLEATIHTVKPVLSLAIAQTLPAANSLVELASFLDQFKVSMAFGGGIFNVIPSLVEHIPGHYLGEKIEDITKVVERLVRAPQSPPQIEPLKIEYEKALKDYQIKRFAIETSVIETNGDISNGFAKDTRDYIFDHIEAGLAFGEIEILEWPLAWLKEFITTFEGSENHYNMVIQSFIRSLDEHMQENGRIVIEFLRRVIN